MKTWMFNRWVALRASFWFVPALFAAGAALLATAALEADSWLLESGRSASWLYSGSPESARSILTMLAGSMIGVAGVTFSITIVALSLTSAQFGPRLLRNFFRDTGNQVSLGTFVATFLYCLLVLRAIIESQPTPAIAVSGATALSLMSLGVLIYFFHHVSTSIQATAVVAAVAQELEDAIDRFCERDDPEQRDESASEAPMRLTGGDTVTSPRSGYVQAVNYEGLLLLATDRDVVIEVLHRAGDFVNAGAPLARIAPAGRLADEDDGRICQAFLTGRQSTEEQDLEYSIRQIVEVALRALSPGINDPFTAINCIDWLGAAIARLAARDMPPAARRDSSGRLRLLLDELTFDGVVDTALQQIRQSGVAHVAVAIRLLDVLAAIAPQTRIRVQAETLRRHADEVLVGSLAASPIDCDRAALEARHAGVLRALEAAGADPEVR